MDESAGIERGSTTISIEGYDPSVYEYSLKLALTKHFASCGKIVDIFVPRDFKRRILKSPLFLTFSEGGPVDKALELNGSDVGGWNVVVKAVPRPEHYVDHARFKFFDGEREMYVSFYEVPSSLPKIDVQIGLCDYFSSCGEVTGVHVMVHGIIGLQSQARISIVGKGCVEKAQKLSGGRNAQGWNIVVDAVLSPAVNVRKSTGIQHPSIVLERLKKAKMENMEKMEKMERLKKAKMEKMEKKMEKMERLKKAKMEKIVAYSSVTKLRRDFDLMLLVLQAGPASAATKVLGCVMQQDGSKSGTADKLNYWNSSSSGGCICGYHLDILEIAAEYS